MNDNDYLSSPLKVGYHLLDSARIYEQTEDNFESSERFWKNGRLSSRVRSISTNIEEELDIVQYYHYSADAGDVAAMVTMGILYMQGIFGVDQDFGTAFQYFSLAAEEVIFTKKS
jgi:TPR repeat protein